MDFLELQSNLDNKFLTDFCLVLKDTQNEITVDVHKIILASSCPYFKKLFSFGEETIHNRAVVNIIDAKIAFDLVMSFYGKNINTTDYPEWLYQLRLYQCRKFFCLQNDTDVLYDMQVPTDGFNEYLTVVLDEFNISNDIQFLYMVKKNIPIGYPLCNLSKELIEELVKLKNFGLLTMDINGSFSIMEGMLERIIDKRKTIKMYDVKKIIVSSHKPYLFSLCGMHEIKVWDFKEKKIIKEMGSDDESFIDIGMSHCGNFVLTFSVVEDDDDDDDDTTPPFSVKIWDANSLELINTKGIDTGTYNIKDIVISPSRKMFTLIARNSPTIIYFYDFETIKMLRKIKTSDNIVALAFFEKEGGNYVAMLSSTNGLKICDTTTYDTVKNVLVTSHAHIMYISADNKKIFIFKSCGLGCDSDCDPECTGDYTYMYVLDTESYDMDKKCFTEPIENFSQSLDRKYIILQMNGKIAYFDTTDDTINYHYIKIPTNTKFVIHYQQVDEFQDKIRSYLKNKINSDDTTSTDTTSTDDVNDINE